MGGAMFMSLPAGSFVHNGVVDDGTILARLPRPHSDAHLTGYFVEVALSEGPAAGETITSLTSALRLVTGETLRMFGGFFPARS
jgi:hypothetical protein